MKYLEPIIKKPLTTIINQSLTTGIFPNKLKIAKIIPVHKKEFIYLIQNYRPISLLPAISKVFERVVYEQLYNYFAENNYYGFRKLHSAEFATLELVDRVTLALDNGNIGLALYLDLSKAFDTLNFDILLSKLNFYGVHGINLAGSNLTWKTGKIMLKLMDINLK